MPNTEELQIVITAKDEAGKVLQALSGKVKTTEAATKSLSTTTQQSGLSFGQMAGAVAIGNLAVSAATSAFHALSGVVKQSITDAKNAQTDWAKIDAILVTLTGNLKQNRQAVEDAGSAALRMGFDDEAGAVSMAKLLQVTGDSTKAHLAFQEAMDLARFKGIGLEEATQAMTLAMNGNVRVLKQLGIEVPAHADRMTILGLVHDRVAGQAEAFGNTAAGAMEKFQQAMENVREHVGSAFLPIFTNILNGISQLVTSETFTGFLKSIERGMETAAAWAKTLSQQLVLIFSDNVKATMVNLNETLKAIGVSSGLAGQGFSTMEILLSPLVGLAQVFLTTLNGVLAGMKALAAAKDKTESILGGFVDFTQNPFGLITPKRAFGGSVSSGSSYMVGENGPEMFVPDAGGKIVPNSSSTSNVTINVGSVRNDADMSAILDTITSVLGRRQELAKKGAY